MEIKRILGEYEQGQGPLFVALAGIHGNEHAGVKAFFRVIQHLEDEQPPFEGGFIGIGGNIPALNKHARFIDIDLNRQWHDEKMEFVCSKPKRDLPTSEDKQQRDLLILFRRLLSQNPNRPIILLDMHTTSAEGAVPFAIANDNDYSKDLALNLGIPVITGLNKIIKGTSLQYFEKLKLTAFGFEGGQHENPESVDRMTAALWLTLHKIGAIAKEDIPNFAEHYDLLHKAGEGLPSLVRFTYRHAIDENDKFVMRPGYKNFQKIEEGEVLADDKSGFVKANSDGMILMPLYQKQGEDGFFIIQSEAIETPVF